MKTKDPIQINCNKIKPYTGSHDIYFTETEIDKLKIIGTLWTLC